MIYNFTIFKNRSNIQTQLKKCCRMIYNFTLEWTGLDWTGVDWRGVGWSGL